MEKKVKITVSILICLGALSGLGVYYLIETAPPKKVVVHDWTELDKIYAISKWCSCIGHSFTPEDEQPYCSMKHYYYVKPEDAPDNSSIKLFACCDGVIVQIFEEEVRGKQVFLQPDEDYRMKIRYMHVNLLDNITLGTHVKAGQLIGYAVVFNFGENADYPNFDIAVQIRGKYISYFQIMTDEVFQKYKEVGIESPDMMIYSIDYRLEHPCECIGEEEYNCPFVNDFSGLVYLNHTA